MANADRARKMLIRTALVTSTTIATLVGAQNLAMLDSRQIEQLITPTAQQVMTQSPASTSAAVPTLTQAPTFEIDHVAPGITILRRPGQTGAVQSADTQVTDIQPPNPVQLAAPEPVVVQSQAPAPVIIQRAANSVPSLSRSSR